MAHRHGNGCARKVIADTQREISGEDNLFHLVLPAPNGDALGICSKAEHREDALLPCGEGHGTVADGGVGLAIAVEIALSFVGGEVQERLEIGNAVPPLLSVAIAKQMLEAMK